MRYIELEEVTSTNSWISQHEGELRDFTLVSAVTQTAGRGQRGNSWEAAPGENLTFSVLHRPADFPARDQFAVSCAVSCAVADYLASRNIEAKVKWPNDVYVADRKIAGILIENSLMGSLLSRTIIGIGININQREFLSDAPNPVSLSQLTGKTYSLAEERISLGETLELRLRSISSAEGRERIHREFTTRMWRGDGKFYPFRDVASGRTYSGRIQDVAPQGFLTVEESSDAPGATVQSHRYAFKEVEFLL